MRGQIIIVAEPSVALRRALDALGDVRNRVLHFSRPSEAAAALARQPLSDPIREAPRAVFIELHGAAEDVGQLVARLRESVRFGQTPIILWAPPSAHEAVDTDPFQGVNSRVCTTSDVMQTSMILTQAIHYWTSANRPPPDPVGTSDPGGPS